MANLITSNVTGTLDVTSTVTAPTFVGSLTGNAATATYATTAGSADQIDGWGFVNTGSNSAVNADTISSNGISYYTGGVPNFSGNATDGALYSQIYSASWQHQIAGDYRSGQIALRGKNNGTWQAWRTVLDSSNFSTWADGAGAADAVNLRIDNEVLPAVGAITLATLGFTGATNANYITNNNQLTNGAGYLTTSGKAADSNLLDGLDSSAYMRDNGWNNNPGQDADTQPVMSSDFSYSNNAPHTGDLIRFGSSGYSLQLSSAYSAQEGALSFRTRNGDNSTWNDWREIWHNGNFNPASYLLAGSKAADSESVDGVDSSRIVFGSNANKTTNVSNVNTALASGFYDGSSATGSPTATWYTYINMRHNNTSNNYGSQIAVSFYSNADMFVRTISNGTYQGWARIWNAANFDPASKEDAGAAAVVNARIDSEVLPAIGAVTLATLGYTGATNANYITNNNELTNGAGYITSQRAISSTPTDGATTTAISSDWAFDNVKTAVPANALFTDNNTTYTAGTGLTLSGTQFSVTANTYAAASHSHGISSITDAPRWWNNFGDNHATRTGFDAQGSALTTGFGWRYVQGPGQGPNVGDTGNGQYYSLVVGLGNDYNYDNYAMQIAIPRISSDPYLSLRFEEGGSLGPWTKISAAYADSAGAVAWANVSSKPSTFTTSAHTHTPAQAGLGNLSSDGNNLAGNFTATGDITAFSDARVKENIETIDNALDKVTQLRGVEYNKIGSEEKSIGVVAQEIREVLPEVVKENEDGMLSVAYGNIAGVLIEAIKEQQKQIEELKAQLDGLTK